MFDTMLLETKVSESLKIVDTNVQLLATALDKANKRIDELEKRIDYLYNDDLP